MINKLIDFGFAAGFPAIVSPIVSEIKCVLLHDKFAVTLKIGMDTQPIYCAEQVRRTVGCLEYNHGRQIPPSAVSMQGAQLLSQSHRKPAPQRSPSGWYYLCNVKPILQFE